VIDRQTDHAVLAALKFFWTCVALKLVDDDDDDDDIKTCASIARI